MCTVCGCSESGESTLERHTHPHHGHARVEHQHEHEPGHDADQHSAHVPHEHPSTTHDYSQGPARAHAPGLSQARMVQIEQDILGKNNEYAAANRRRLVEQGVLALNLVSSPGSGKTTLLTHTIHALKGELSLAVIEGDQQTANDARRIRETGVKAVQINTGKGCHLDAHMVDHALDAVAPERDSVLFIENVGNLVCPAAFDLGEAHKVAILSVTEGEDKPIKYPDMFHAADLLLLNKIDLLPHVQFDVEACIRHARQVNTDIKVLQVSATTGAGMDAWYRWIRASRDIALLGQ